MSLGPAEQEKVFSCFCWCIIIIRKKIERAILSRPAVEAGETRFLLRYERKS